MPGSQADGDDLRLAVSKKMIKNAPGIDSDGHLGDDQNKSLRDYYAEYLDDSARTDSAQADSTQTA